MKVRKLRAVGGRARRLDEHRRHGPLSPFEAVRFLGGGREPRSPAWFGDLASPVDGLDAGALDRLEREVERRRTFFSLPRMFERRPEWAFVAGQRTDTSLLRNITFDAMHLDLESFERLVDELLGNLESRIDEFQEPDFDIVRFQGWCGSLSHLAGCFHFSNRYFLYKLGTMSDEVPTLHRMQALIGRGLDEARRRGFPSVTTPSEWAACFDDPLYEPRRRLANAISYVAREAYVLDSSHPLDDLGERLAREFMDVLVLSVGFAGLPFTSARDGYLTAAQEAVVSTAEFFTGGTDAAYRSFVRHPFQPWVPLREILSATVRAASSLRRRDLVDGMLADLDVSRQELLGVGGLAAARAMEFQWPGDDVHDLTLARAELVELDEGLPSTGISAQLTRASAFHAIGATTDAREIFPPIDSVRSMSLADVYPYMTLAPLLLGHHELAQALYALRSRLVTLARQHASNITFLARAIQYDTLVDNHFALAHANLGCELVARPPAPLVDAEPGHHSGADDREHPVAVLFMLDQCRVTPSLIAPLTGLLGERGVSFHNLQVNGFVNEVVRPWQLSPRVSGDSAALEDTVVRPSALLLDWTIDLDAGVLVAGGVNYFEGMYERVGRVLKVFHVDWSLPSAQLYFWLWLRQIDRVVYAMTEAIEVARERGMSLRFVTLQSHFVPYYAVKQTCAANSDRAEHVTVSSSYENWRSNVDGSPLSTLTLLNNTRHPAPSMPAFGTEESFERWYADEFLPHRERYEAVNDELTGIRRAGQSGESEAMLDRIRDARRSGGLVFCALGKIPYDLAVPDQGGPAHRDMSDWINHTIATVEGSDNTLIVKPHPHELSLEISGKPIEGFLDLFEADGLGRTIVLPHRGVSLQDLRGIVDVFLCWNGSSITEIGSWGERVLAADAWAPRNYPVGVALPADRAEYEAMLRGEREVVMSDDFRTRCVAYNCYLTEAPFAIEYPFVFRSSTNVNFNNATLRFSQFDSANRAKLNDRRDDVLDAFGVAG